MFSWNSKKILIGVILDSSTRPISSHRFLLGHTGGVPYIYRSPHKLDPNWVYLIIHVRIFPDKPSILGPPIMDTPRNGSVYNGKSHLEMDDFHMGLPFFT